MPQVAGHLVRDNFLRHLAWVEAGVKLRRRRLASGARSLPRPRFRAMHLIRTLPVESIAEIEDFVAFVASREQIRALTRAAASASLPVFAAIWDNPDDAAYDEL